jgi:LysR family carnitine catabolism transcriptional activator
MSVNLKLLNAFLLIAEHGSFRRAAELSRRSQSALSLQVRELEGQLGAPLFHRTTRRVSLTREGEVLLPHARRAIAEMDAGLRRVRAATSMHGGSLALGCPPHIAEAVLPPLLAEFCRARPGIAIRIHDMPQAAVLESVRRQELDFGIGPRPAQSPSLVFTPLLEEAILALAPPRLVPAGARSIALAALGALPVIITSGTNSLREMVEEAAASIGVSLDVRCSVQMPGAAMALAAQGLGVAIIPQLALPQRRLAALRVLRITEPPLLREMGIVRLRGARLAPSAQAFLDLLHARLAAAPRLSGLAAWPGTPDDGIVSLPSPGAATASPGSMRAAAVNHKRVSPND